MKRPGSTLRRAASRASIQAGRHYLLFVVAVLFASTAHAEIEGKVVAVTDGDTIKVLDAANVLHKVRLTGIDAPEKAQPYGEASRQHLARLVAGKAVRIESTRRDRYGRVLGKVWVQPGDCPSCGKTLNANHAQILSGMAWWYHYYAGQQSEEDRGRYKSAVTEARARRWGLWQDPDPIPPWAWRRGLRSTLSERASIDASCGTKRYCDQMNSCEEALFYLRNCAAAALDGDGDGVPCESICR